MAMNVTEDTGGGVVRSEGQRLDYRSVEFLRMVLEPGSVVQIFVKAAERLHWHRDLLPLHDFVL